MQIDVAISISELLYENSSVIIPDFGGLVSTYRTATVDQVQGVFSPPAKDLTFNSNLVTNDGLLTNYVKSKYNLSFIEAERAITTFVNHAKATLDRRENVLLPEVGRLYKDYENKIQFLPDNTNFNTQSYGLPPVQFYPVLRDRDLNKGIPTASTSTITKPETSANTIPEVAATTGTKTAPIAEKGLTHFMQKLIPFLAGAAILVLALTMYLFLSKDEGVINTGSEFTQEDNNPPIRINQKPGSEEEEIYDSNEEEIVDELGEISEVDTEGETIAPNQKECIIIIGGFGKKSNVDRLVEKIYEAGYDAYTDRKGKLTRVGVMFAYKNEYEVDSALEDVKGKFNRKAWILAPESMREN